MTYQPTHLTRWTLPANYFGAEWPDWYPVVGHSRDSDDLEESNYQTALARLQAIEEPTEWAHDGPPVLEIRESHWAVGWVEWIGIHKDAEDALREGDKIREELEGYPVLDDDDFSRREWEHAETIWRECYSARERIAYLRKNGHRAETIGDLLATARGDLIGIEDPTELIR